MGCRHSTACGSFIRFDNHRPNGRDCDSGTPQGLPPPLTADGQTCSLRPCCPLRFPSRDFGPKRGYGPLVGGHLPFEVQTTASGFVKMGIAIDNGPAGSPDSVWARDGSTINEADGSFKMWYVGSDGAQWRILLATSSDGILWTKHG